MMIVKNNSYDKVAIKILSESVVIEPHDKVLVDDVVGETLREIQPQLSYFDVPRKEEDKIIEEFKQKKIDDEKAKKAEADRIAKQIEDMEAYRAERLAIKKKEREAKLPKAESKAKLKGVKPKKVVDKAPVKIKKSNKKKK